MTDEQQPVTTPDLVDLHAEATDQSTVVDALLGLLADAGAGAFPVAEAGQATRAAVDALLRGKGADVYTFEDWQVLDAHELAQGQGQGRPRAKVVHKHEMLTHRRKA